MMLSTQQKRAPWWTSVTSRVLAAEELDETDHTMFAGGCRAEDAQHPSLCCALLPLQPKRCALQ